MSKEILHRAKRTDTGEWVEGYYVKLKLTGTAYILPGDVEVEPCKKGVLQFVKYQVDPETVCRHTGLKDVKKRKIFDGDVCKDVDNIVRILWSDKHQWGVEILKTDHVLSRGLIFPLWQYDNCKENGYRELEVVGNIFDDFELLEGRNE